jgi:hypothetical protein
MRTRLLLASIPAAAALAFAAPALAADPQAVSANWAGYEATANSSNGFSAVSGAWTQPKAQCGTTGESQYSAFWVGLGGGGNGSQALEQIGTQADCSADGSASYYAWYELVPAGAVRLNLQISAGDRIWARTAVDGDSVRVQLRDETTGQSVDKTLQMTNPAPDTSTAEWVAEAPSSCADSTTLSCSTLPLADFGTAKFSDAYATSNGVTGAIDGSQWSTAAIDLQPSDGSAGASPSSLSNGSTAFTVSYSGDSSAAGGSGAAAGYGYGYPSGGYGSYGGYGSGGSSAYGYGDGYGDYGYGDGYGYGYSDAGGYGSYGYGYYGF